MNRASLILEGLGILVVSAYTTVAALQWCQMRKATHLTKLAADAAKNSAITAQKQLEMSERPWVLATHEVYDALTFSSQWFCYLDSQADVGKQWAVYCNKYWLLGRCHPARPNA